MTKKLIDLHTHSKASDGSMTPSELVWHARENGLAAIAITDHDTVEGVEEALRESDRTGLDVIPGVEISVDYNGEMHMLGYFSRENYRNIHATLDNLKRNREERNPKIIRKLNEMGFNISMEEVERESGGNIVARPHFAAVLLKKGYVSSISEAFEKYLASGKPAYFKKDKLTPQEGIRIIREGGGIPVLAHPRTLMLDFKETERLVKDMAEWGLGGMEVFYVENTPEETKKYEAMAQRYGLLATGGSDFHGSFKPDIKIGIGHGNLAVPYEAYERLIRQL